MLLDLLGEAQRFGPPFGLHHPGVAAAGAGVGGRRRIRPVLAGEHAARQRAVADHAQAVMGARRQMLGFRHAVHGVVIRLADDRAIDPETIAQAADLGHAPSPVVRNAEIADLAEANEVAHGTHRLLEGCVVILLVQIVDVQVIGAEPFQARIGRLHHPFAREAALVHPLAHRVGELGRQDPLVPLCGDASTGDLLGTALVIGIGRVDEIHAGIAGASDDPHRCRLVGRPAEHHGAEAERRYLQSAPAELAIFQVSLRPIYSSITVSNSAGRMISSTSQSSEYSSTVCLMRGG